MNSLVIDKDGNIYDASSMNGKVYKCLAGEINFTEMSGTTDSINSIMLLQKDLIQNWTLNTYNKVDT